MVCAAPTARDPRLELIAHCTEMRLVAQHIRHTNLLTRRRNHDLLSTAHALHAIVVDAREQRARSRPRAHAWWLPTTA
jgi:hypothetical protein